MKLKTDKEINQLLDVIEVILNDLQEHFGKKSPQKMRLPTLDRICNIDGKLHDVKHAIM